MTEAQKAAIRKVAEELKALPHDEFMKLLSEAGESDMAAIMRELLKPQPAQDNQEAAEQAAEKHHAFLMRGLQSATGPTAQTLRAYSKSIFLAGAKWQKAEDAKEIAAIEERRALWTSRYGQVCKEFDELEKERDALKQQVAELNLHIANKDALADIYLAKLTEAERREREAVAEREGLKEALRHYNSDAMRLGSTISPRHADAALAAFPEPTEKR